MTLDFTFDETIHRRTSVLLLIFSPLLYILLTQIIVAPFGKHSETITTIATSNTTCTNKTIKSRTFNSINSKNFNWGTSLNPKIAWFVMESPNLIWCIYAYQHRNRKVLDTINITVSLEENEERHDYANIVLFAMFFIHYFNRCIVYPLRMKKGSSPVNLTVFSCAFLFCTINGFLQAQNYCQFQTYTINYHTNLHFRIGVTVWFIGFFINLQSDSILRNLRNHEDEIDTSSSSSITTSHSTKTDCIKTITIPKYKIPYGGLFNHVSCANFFGEILEWFGYAIASSSVAAWAFWFFVCANLIPRGIAHHKWYLQKFDEYPKDRYAVIPFIM